jgi:flagellar basal body-associated protein FliL
MKTYMVKRALIIIIIIYVFSVFILCLFSLLYFCLFKQIRSLRIFCRFLIFYFLFCFFIFVNLREGEKNPTKKIQEKEKKKSKYVRLSVRPFRAKKKKTNKPVRLSVEVLKPDGQDLGFRTSVWGPGRTDVVNSYSRLVP